MKNKNIKFIYAVLIALFFGLFGLQEFYINNLVRGILGIIFWWTFIPAIVALVQICIWLYNGEEWFDSKYNEAGNKNPLND